MNQIYPGKDAIVFLDGKFLPAREVSLGLFSQTVHYGNGVFEGLRSYETNEGMRIFKSRDHFRRLKQSAEKMMLSLPYSPEELTLFAYELLDRNGLKEAYIRPLVFLENDLTLTSGQKSHIMMACWKWGKLLGDKLLHTMISSYRRPDPRSIHIDAKVCGHYVNNILATTEAKQKGFDDAILLDVDGYVSAGTAAAIFYEKDEVLYTPLHQTIFPSITRKVVIELAEKFGIIVLEKNSTLEEFMAADGAFFTGTAAEIEAIGTVNRKSFKMQWEDTIGFMLSRKYRQLVTRGKNFQQTMI